MLNRLRGQPLADLCKHRFTGIALALRPYLDQLMPVQMDFDLVQHRIGKAIVADQHHRMQRMGLAAQRTAQRGSQLSAH